jgi:protein-tyrosine phosphatase
VTSAQSSYTVERLISDVLRRPAAMAVKSRLRNAIWRIRGLAVRNPPPPLHPQTVLFVCKGNICRSAFAAEIARRMQPELRWLSAGFNAAAGTPPPIAAVEAAHRVGISLRDHRSTPLSASLVSDADLILVMEAWHLTLLRSAYPEDRHKIHLLAFYDPARDIVSAYDRFNIDDPYGKSPEVFDECFARLTRTIASLKQSTSTASTIDK